MFRRITRFIVIAAAFALSACAVVSNPGYFGYTYVDRGYDNDIAVAPIAPPAPYTESRPALPYAGAIWIDGYWGWAGERHAWIPGHWDHPRADYDWAPHRWALQDGQWHLHSGGWVRR